MDTRASARSRPEGVLRMGFLADVLVVLGVVVAVGVGVAYAYLADRMVSGR